MVDREITNDKEESFCANAELLHEISHMLAHFRENSQLNPWHVPCERMGKYGRVTEWIRVRVQRIFLHDRAAVFRFLIVGAGAFIVRTSTYTLFSRVLWTTGPRTFENLISLVCAVLFSYLCNQRWTFRFHEAARGSFVRFITVSFFSNTLEAGLFHVLHSLFQVYDFAVIIFNSGAIAFLSFFLHRRFTFHPDPWGRRRPVADPA